MTRNDPMARINQTATAVAEKVRDARLDDRASELAALAMEKLRESDLEAKAAEIAAVTRSRIKDSGLDDLATDVVARVREAAVALQESDAAQHAADTAREVTDKTLGKVGEWLGDTAVGDRLADTTAGERLGLCSPRKRPWWALALIAGAAAAGTAVAVMRGRTEAEDPWAGEEFTETTPPSSSSVAPTVADRPLEERVRDALGQDPRTEQVARLNVNIVEGTVFVRGAVGADVDRDVLRQVIEGVEGVTDVDLQVTVAT